MQNNKKPTNTDCKNQINDLSSKSSDTIRTEDTFSSDTENDSDLEDFIEYDIDYCTKSSCIKYQIECPKVKELRDMSEAEFEEYVTQKRLHRQYEMKKMFEKYEQNDKAPDRENND